MAATWFRFRTQNSNKSTELRRKLEVVCQRTVNETKVETLALVRKDHGERWTNEMAKRFNATVMHAPAPMQTVESLCGREFLSSGSRGRHQGQCPACKRLSDNRTAAGTITSVTNETRPLQVPAVEPDLVGTITDKPARVNGLAPILKAKAEEALHIASTLEAAVDALEKLAPLKAELEKHKAAVKAFLA